MYSLRFKCGAEEVELLSGELWEAGTAGIRELEDGEGVILIAGFPTNDDRAELLERFAGRDTQWEQEDATDWVEETHLAWPPRLVGERIFLAPPWCKDVTPSGRVRVTHNPGLACGTGEHPCTQLALAAIEEADITGKFVVDIGTGSGVLAIAALRLGARVAAGVDTDVAALAAARENFELNELAPALVAGSAECLRDGCADVTVANISGTVLLSVSDELLRISGAQARLILTGFSKDELAAIEQHFGTGGVTSCGEWRCLAVQLS
jgi:ribosomal protein L11 methyltransferase